MQEAHPILALISNTLPMNGFLPNNRTFRIVFLACLIVFGRSGVAAQVKDDARPVVDDSKTTPSQVRDPKLPTLFIVGDSTLNSGAPLRGWGQELGQFFDQTKFNVVNRAIGGR